MMKILTAKELIEMNIEDITQYYKDLHEENSDKELNCISE